MPDRGVAVVTGASKGIGAATARRLAADGLVVCVAYGSDVAGAEAVVAEIVAAGGSAWAATVDVADERSIGALFATVDAAGRGRLAALVNNAGVVAPRARVAEVDAARVRRLLDINVLGPVLCSREAVRRMSTLHGGAGGAIVNVSSSASRLGSPGEYVDYAATKGAVDTFTIGLGREVAAEGIRVNAVRPGTIDTGIHATGGQPDRAARVGATTPAGRPGEADEVAAAIAWLVSDEASYCNGTIIDVAGGR
jgi:NAD(P)-dependent dehydrogenase (short-subunit alcohol dehydrogenase family)